MMTTLMFLLAATLLVVCLLEFAAILGLRSMVEDSAGTIEATRKSLDTYKLRHERMAELLAVKTTEYEAAVQRLDESREEASRATRELEVAKLSLKNAQEQFAEQLDCELAIAKLSLKNARDQVADHVATTGRAIADREEYRDALKDVARRLLYAGDVLDDVKNEGKFE
jgi:chromosome segregation ATPase